jgi:selenocysteine lyase/cysteine desulfurase
MSDLLSVAAPGRGVSRPPLLPVVGAELTVPLVDGRRVRAVDLDLAASAPALVEVAAAVDELLPWYSSVHRGAGFPSVVCTELVAASRDAIGRFVGARPDDLVVLTRHTTDGLNLLATALPGGSRVVTLATEHHANLLPWRRRHRAVELAVPPTRAELLARLEAELDREPVDLVAVTGASNVTGELLPIAEITAAAHRRGARVVVDGAQLVPHRPVDLSALDADYLAFSGHKLYAPYGAGALVGRADWLERADPYLAGGGAVRRVRPGDVEWVAGAGRHEAGTPNVVGALALATACEVLAGIGPDALVAHERDLVAALLDGLGSIDAVTVHRFYDDGGAEDAVGIVAFDVAGWDPGLVAAVLSAEFGVGLRDGGFCAHQALDHLHGTDGSVPRRGLLRASVGVSSRPADVERLIDGLGALMTRGPAWSYEVVDGRHRPVDDPRPRPRLLRQADAGGA